MKPATSQTNVFDSNRCKEPHLDILIIGAGWSGLYAAKYVKQEGLNFKILESRDDFGGVWNYTDSPKWITVMRNTVSSSSRHVTEASDFPMSQEFGNFMRHQDVMDYLRDYSAQFDLHKDNRYNSRVVSAEKNEDKDWVVKTSDEALFTASKLIVCAGVHQTQRKIVGPVSSFGGQIYHAGDFKHFDDLTVSEADHVIVYGGGETASDIIEQLVKKPCQLTWAIRGGQHFFRKAPLRPGAPPGQYDRWDNALDTQSTLIHALLTDFEKSKPGMRYGCNLASSGSVFSYQGHGLQVWKNETPWYHDAFNKNGHAVEYVWSGRVKAAPKIDNCQGQEVVFEDGSTVNATHIICCFGYTPKLDFLPEWATQRPTHLMYKLVFHPDDPSLSFIGYARPTILSIPFMAELQCIWASQIWAGKQNLPDSEIMRQEAKADLASREAYFPDYSNKNLVHPRGYAVDIFKLTGMKLFNESVSKNRWLKYHLPSMPFSPFLTYIMRGKYSKGDEQRVRDHAFPSIYYKSSPGKPAFGGSTIKYAWNGILRIGLMRLLSADTFFDLLAKRRMNRYGSSMRNFTDPASKVSISSEGIIERLENRLDRFVGNWFRQT